jgi:hypothetical protein
MNHKPYSEFETRHQIRDFAHTLDAVSLILKATGFRVHKLRDTIDALQGAAGGRREFKLSHAKLALRLEHKDDGRAAEVYAFRKVAALKKEQKRVGIMFFGIESGGGLEREPMRYTDYLTPAANWAMQQARISDLWKEHPGKALAAQISAAIEMLPLISSEDEKERDSMPLDDDDYIQRMIAQSVNCALKACDRAAENGRDDIAIARMAAERLLRYAEDRHKARQTPDAQICASGDEEPTMQAAALDYVTHDDVPVFPCRPDKSPYTSNGFKDATRDEATIRHLWRKWPDAQIGIPTGEASDWLVLDIDPRHGGDASLSELIEAHGDLPQTLEARTGGGGHHIIFEYPKGSNIRNSAGKLGEGIDVRAEGGYIVVAPSLHASGRRYEWQNNYQPAPVPEFLFKLLTEEKPIPEASRAGEACSGAKSGAAIEALINEGERNDKLFQIGCALRGYDNATHEEIEAHLIEVNAARCVPPLPLDEVQKIARSAAKYSANRVAVGA